MVVSVLLGTAPSGSALASSIDTAEHLLGGEMAFGSGIAQSSIPADGMCTLTGTGLREPLVLFQDDSDPRTKFLTRHSQVRYWRASGTGASVRLSTLLQEGGLLPAEFRLCGVLAPGPFGMGASCGASSAHSTRGRVRLLGPGWNESWYQIEDLAWMPSAGNVSIAGGRVQRISPAWPHAPLGPEGTLDGVVSIRPRLLCEVLPPSGGSDGQFLAVLTMAVKS
jgi:hypothetical protein